jgi:MoxR-like ATPase
VPYPSSETLKAAAADLAGSHPLTVVTIPALLRAGQTLDNNPLDAQPLPMIPAFGTKQERPVLEAFRLRNSSKSPYLAVWQNPPVFIREDYPGSTLQRLRTQDLLGQELFEIEWNEERTKRIGTAIRPTAGSALTERNVKPISRLSLALWLGRDQDLPSLDAFLDWFDATYPLDGTDLDGFYKRDMPSYANPDTPMEGLLWKDQATNDDLISAIVPATNDEAPLDVPSTTPPRAELPDVEAGDDELRWTRDFCAYPLRDADVRRIAQAVLRRLDETGIVLPAAESLVTRCVTALLVGHLVLQGPPGTGKTTLARILADAFDVHLLESTATSEWSPFHVVGGLRPAADGSLQPSYGKVADAALKCAIHVRADVTAEAEGEPDAPDSQTRRWQGTWLLIDEFNRADIDKAIGSLYTLLSSCDAAHLERSPIDLWFESEGRQQLWVPARFRIIASMNDLDTSFVNPISQGLTRRFQFITVGTPVTATDSTGLNAETENSLRTAYEWLSSTYGAVLKLDTLDATRERLSTPIASLQSLIAGLRETTDTVPGWPVGTAQVVDVMRVLLLQSASEGEPAQALDWGIADRLVPQMGQLDELLLTRAAQLFEQAGMMNARSALQHLLDPHAT